MTQILNARTRRIEKFKQDDLLKDNYKLALEKRAVMAEWNDLTYDCPLLHETLKDMFDLARTYTPNLFALHSFVMVSVLCGSYYKAFCGGNVNLYAIGIANTGAGKETSRRYFEKLFSVIGCSDFITSETLAGSNDFEDDLRESPNVFYMIDEIGFLLSNFVKNHSVTGINKLVTALTTAWSSQNLKLGRGRNKNEIYNISVNIYGTTTRKALVAGITEETLQTGQMNRYVVAEDIDVPVNMNCERGSGDVSSRVIELWREFASKIDRNKVVEVSFSEDDTKLLNKDLALIGSFIKDNGVDGLDKNVNAYARIVENSIRLACLYAIAKNPEKPVFNSIIYRRLNSFVEHGIERMIDIAQENQEVVVDRLKIRKKVGERDVYRDILDFLKFWFLNEKRSVEQVKKGMYVSRCIQIMAQSPLKYGYDKNIHTPKAFKDTAQLIVDNREIQGLAIRGEKVYMYLGNK